MINYKKKLEVPIYLKEIIKKNPKLMSGRKNYKSHEKRISDTINLIKKYKKNNQFK